MNYWQWLIRGSGAGPGIRRFVDRWLIAHILIATSISWLNPTSLMSTASSLLLPLAGIFIGLSFAWGGNAQALLETVEIREMADHHPGGFEEYIFTYQSTVLLILTTLVLWGLAGLGIFDKTWPKSCREGSYFTTSFLLFFFASITVRECWHVVVGAHWLLMARYRIKRELDKTNKNS